MQVQKFPLTLSNMSFLHEIDKWINPFDILIAKARPIHPTSI